MSLILDTHAAIWYLADSPQLSPAARIHIESEVKNAEVLFISAISLVEIVYLCERGKLPAEALQRLEGALRDTAAGMAVAPVDAATAETVQKIPRAIVPDMPDRIIAATAVHLNTHLVTKDLRLHEALGPRSIW